MLWNDTLGGYGHVVGLIRSETKGLPCPIASLDPDKMSRLLQLPIVKKRYSGLETMINFSINGREVDLASIAS